MFCKNLLKRQRQTKTVLFCKNKQRYIISLETCKNCSDFIVVRNRPIRKVSDKKIIVTEKTYNEVLNRDKCCRLCGNTLNLQLHHIIYRSENKNLINDPTNCIMLCEKHHRLVHSNKKYWQPILKEMIKNG